MIWAQNHLKLPCWKFKTLPISKRWWSSKHWRVFWIFCWKHSPVFSTSVQRMFKHSPVFSTAVQRMFKHSPVFSTSVQRMFKHSPVFSTSVQRMFKHSRQNTPPVLLNKVGVWSNTRLINGKCILKTSAFVPIRITFEECFELRLKTLPSVLKFGVFWMSGLLFSTYQHQLRHWYAGNDGRSGV